MPGPTCSIDSGRTQRRLAGSLAPVDDMSDRTLACPTRTARRQRRMVGIFVLDSDYDSLLRKGVVDSISDRLEDGLLHEAITIHPFALHERRIEQIGRAHV